ncbi:thioredoxin family protein [Candidatus Woesearchaeota archaeon]|nr:thioredoxin family protein [Candidatus Woesearchaeota archaeon]
MKMFLPVTFATALSGISFPSYTQPEPERTEIQQLQDVPPHDLTDILDARNGFIFFSIDGCPACRRTLPHFQALEQEAEAACISSDALDFDYVNLSHEQPEPSDFIREEIQYVPTIIEVQNGRGVHQYVGAGEEFNLFEARVRNLIQQYR